MDKEHLFQLTDAYKEQIFTKLYELVPSRMAKLDHDAFTDKTTEEVLVLTYMQGVGEALDAFDMSELLREVARADAEKSGLEA